MHKLFKENKKILIASVIVLLFFVFGIIIFFQKNTPKTNIVPVSYNPPQQATKISPLTVINVVFSRPATLDEEKNISLSILPKSNNSALWSNDKKSIYFTTNIPLSLATQYQVTLTVFSNKFTWYFTTASGTELSTSDQAKLQGAADLQYSASEQAFIKKYPWYSKLPPQNNDYFILFDNSVDTFYILIYPKSSVSTPQSDQITNMENEATQELKSIGVDVSAYKIVWQINPK